MLEKFTKIEITGIEKIARLEEAFQRIKAKGVPACVVTELQWLQAFKSITNIF